MARREYKTWLPFISIGWMLTLVLGGMAFYGIKNMTETHVVLAEEQNAQDLRVPTVVEYRSQVQEIIKKYNDTENASVAYTELFNMTVPPSLQSVHLSLVIAFDSFRKGDSLKGRQIIDSLTKTNSWIAL